MTALKEAVLCSIADSWITNGAVLLLTQRSMSPIGGTFAINSDGVAKKVQRARRTGEEVKRGEGRLAGEGRPRLDESRV